MEEEVGVCVIRPVHGGEVGDFQPDVDGVDGVPLEFANRPLDGDGYIVG